MTVGAWELDILSLIGLIVICAYLASKGIQRRGVPQVVGFILVGVLLGSSFLNVVPLALVFGALASATAPATAVDVIHEYRAEGPLPDGSSEVPPSRRGTHPLHQLLSTRTKCTRVYGGTER